ncbi:hypothetical protein [Massilia sp. TWR1-2-2]|uniref:hypothetical protein n=1 Tax=Massilia sp. TWR1-2-2 TaxID=2804584 RepID=UPI003CEB17A4
MRADKALLAALAIAALAAVGWLAAGDDRAAPAQPAVALAAAPSPAPAPGGRIGPANAPPAPMRRQQLAQNLQLAERTYCSYLASSRYPHGSRPIAEQPDQVYPNAPVTASNPLRLDGGGSDPKVRIQTSQSRVYLAAGEAVAFSLRAVDPDGQVLPLVIARALAQGMTFNGARAGAQAQLAFADDGRLADPVAGDGAFAAVLAPAQGALASFNGTIRTDVRFSVAGRAGVVTFDVVHTPELPATWTGKVREALEDGSLHFYLAADVRQAGRYIVSGRVDDANGRPFALATFNDLLRAGPQEVRLTTFGKLLRDQQPALPLTLRDVDGYLLKENSDPDRALMPRLEGRAFVGKPHPLTAFSGAEWQSEERSRYLAEFGKDLRQARRALAAADPAAPLPPGACTEPAAN